jgi:hypothetical protein
MRYVLDTASLDSLVAGDLTVGTGCVVLVPASCAQRAAAFRSNGVRIEVVTEQESAVDDLQMDDEGISWSQTGGPDAQSLIAFCLDEGLHEDVLDGDISAIRIALQQKTILVSDDETLQILMSAFGGQSLPTVEFAAAPRDL